MVRLGEMPPEDQQQPAAKEVEQFTRCFAEKMLTYALGRGLEAYDRCTVDGIVNAAEPNDHRFSSLVTAIDRPIMLGLHRYF